MIRLANLKSDPDYVRIQQLVIIQTRRLIKAHTACRTIVPTGKEDRAHRRADRGGARRRLHEFAGTR